MASWLKQNGRMLRELMCRELPSCIFSALVSLFTLQSNIPRLLLALLICISPLREERFTISTHLPNSENVSCRTARSRIGFGGTIAIGLRMCLAWIHSRSAHFCLPQSANFRFGCRVFKPGHGKCAANAQPWELTMRWEPLRFSPRVRAPNQRLDGWCWI